MVRVSITNIPSQLIWSIGRISRARPVTLPSTIPRELGASFDSLFPGLCAQNVLPHDFWHILVYRWRHSMSRSDYTALPTLPREHVPRPSARFSGWMLIYMTVNVNFPAWQWSSTLGSVVFPNGYHRAYGEITLV